MYFDITDIESRRILLSTFTIKFTISNESGFRFNQSKILNMKITMSHVREDNIITLCGESA